MKKLQINNKHVLLSLIILLFASGAMYFFVVRSSSLSADDIREYDRTLELSIFETRELGTYRGLKVKAVEFCSDICRGGPRDTFIVYDGVNEGLCDVLHGEKEYVIGWSTYYVGCRPVR